MKKNILSAAVAAVCIAAMMPAAFAEINPVVEVNNREIVFPDQKPVILEQENRTMVPARGIFEYMGAIVNWDDEKQLVDIKQGGKQIQIVIGEPTMTVYTYSAQNLFAAPAKEEITLDAPPRLMNDRTMIPLRAISESLGAKVDWVEDENKVTIFTKDYVAPVVEDNSSSTGNTGSDTQTPAETDKTEKALTFSLTADKTTAEVGDTVEVTVNIANIPEGAALNTLTLGLIYDHSKFEYVEDSMTLVNNDISKYMTAVNDKFTDDSLKASAITVNENATIKQSGAVAKLTFKVLSKEQGAFALSTRYEKQRGYDNDTSILKDGKTETVGSKLVIDTTPVTIN